MKAYVDRSKRIATQRAHTATHLLHAALAERFPSTRQSGSLVDEDYCRFDFTHEAILSTEELSSITEQMNQRVRQAIPVSILEMSYDDAIAQGAKAFFEDTYGDQVRVVRIGTKTSMLSQELCGGMHVNNTSDIGGFIIVDHTSVASGVKRITAYVGNKVASHARDLRDKQAEYARILQVQPAHIEAKLHKYVQEYILLEEQVSQLTSSLMAYIVDSRNLSHGTTQKDKQGNPHPVFKNIDEYDVFSSIPWKQAIQGIRSTLSPDDFICLFTCSGRFACIGPSAKEYVAIRGWKGGGSSTFIQGKDASIMSYVTKHINTDKEDLAK